MVMCFGIWFRACVGHFGGGEWSTGGFDFHFHAQSFLGRCCPIIMFACFPVDRCCAMKIMMVIQDFLPCISCQVEKIVFGPFPAARDYSNSVYEESETGKFCATFHVIRISFCLTRFYLLGKIADFRLFFYFSFIGYTKGFPSMCATKGGEKENEILLVRKLAV